MPGNRLHNVRSSTDTSGVSVAWGAGTCSDEKVVSMVTQEAFKRRVRERMRTTGERYTAARRHLLEQASPGRRRTWKSEPEVRDEAVQAATGRGWEDWCDFIEAWPGHSDGHTAIAAYLLSTGEVDAWWAQSVTGGYERIVGLRLPHQRPDGTFTGGKSRIVDVDRVQLRALLLDDDARRSLFPGHNTELCSRPTSKVIRIRIGPGVAHISLTEASDERSRVSIDHRQLPSVEAVEEWKFFWAEWLDVVGTSST